jgi:hypothetical protein
MAIHDTAGEIDEILRNGGEFWLIEVHNPDRDLEGVSRVHLRDTDRFSVLMELAAERMRRPDLVFVPKRIRVETVIEEP